MRLKNLGLMFINNTYLRPNKKKIPIVLEKEVKSIPINQAEPNNGNVRTNQIKSIPINQANNKNGKDVQTNQTKSTPINQAEHNNGNVRKRK